MLTLRFAFLGDHHPLVVSSAYLTATWQGLGFSVALGFRVQNPGACLPGPCGTRLPPVNNTQQMGPKAHANPWASDLSIGLRIRKLHLHIPGDLPQSQVQPLLVADRTENRLSPVHTRPVSTPRSRAEPNTQEISFPAGVSITKAFFTGGQYILVRGWSLIWCISAVGLNHLCQGAG